MKFYCYKHTSSLRSFPIFKVSLKLMKEAMRDLKTAGGFKLWVYFNSKSNGKEFLLSSEIVERELGLSQEDFKTALEELITKEYLVKKELGKKKDFYWFYEGKINRDLD